MPLLTSKLSKRLYSKLNRSRYASSEEKNRIITSISMIIQRGRILIFNSSLSIQYILAPNLNKNITI